MLLSCCSFNLLIASSHFEINVSYSPIVISLFSKNFNIELLLRKGWSANVKKGAVQLGIDFKIPIDYLIKYGINPSFYTEFFAGYGENLMNYNEFQIRYRFGGMLSF